jgi:chromosome segregation ATPase
MADEANDLSRRILEEVLGGRRALDEGIERLGTRLDWFRDETLSNFDGAFLRIEKAESEVQAISAALGRIERLVEGDRPARETLRLEINRLRERLTALEKRLAEGESGATEPH